VVIIAAIACQSAFFDALGIGNRDIRKNTATKKKHQTEQKQSNEENDPTETRHISADELNMATDVPTDVSATIITELKLGNQAATKPIYLYISPSCLHCGRMLVEEVVGFVEKNGDKHCVIVKFLTTSAKDLFIMKMIQNETSNQERYFAILQNFIKRGLATIDRIQVTEEQQALYKGSDKDQEMIKYQVLAEQFGFSSEQIQKARPNMTEKYELTVMKQYKEAAEEVAKVLETKELNLPLIVWDGKCYKDIGTAKEAIEKAANESQKMDEVLS
jgi:hypothetical protein